jgi:hypothetical protein
LSLRALHALLQNIVRASEIVGFELTEFEAPKFQKFMTKLLNHIQVKPLLWDETFFGGRNAR